MLETISDNQITLTGETAFFYDEQRVRKTNSIKVRAPATSPLSPGVAEYRDAVLCPGWHTDWSVTFGRKKSCGWLLASLLWHSLSRAVANGHSYPLTIGAGTV